MRDVLKQLILALEQDRELMLCQVVETRGSTPQKAGAMMVLDPAAVRSGPSGGGCVENEVKRRPCGSSGGTTGRSILPPGP